jgi:DeoR/GlpR family transcriptional regulator of sugar metabolism
MKESISAITARRTAFKETILRLKANQPYTFEQFAKAAQYQYKIKKGSEGLTERQIKYDLAKLEEAIRPRRVIFVSGGLEIKDDEEATSFGQRKRSAHDVKELIGAGLWHFMLGEGWHGSEPRPKPDYTLHTSKEQVKEQLLMKKRALTLRNQIYMAADAGSSTLAAIKVLLSAEHVPLEIRNTKEPHDSPDNSGSSAPLDYRIIEPVLLTNSFPIAEAVASSGRHRWSFVIEFIGGIMRPGRNCTTGELTSVWLHVCCAEGRMGTLDLAIVGVTGVTFGHNGILAVACDDAEEAALKRKFLEMASNGLRVMMFHAAKLLFPEARCRFAVITKSMVDVIAVDSGSNEMEHLAVKRLIDSVTPLGVGVLVMKNPKYTPPDIAELPKPPPAKTSPTSRARISRKK